MTSSRTNQRLTLLAALLLSPALALAGGWPADPGLERDATGKLPRSRALLAEFKRANPCPATGKPRGPCPGYEVDHICPLKRRGCADTPDNMQWLTVEEHRRKSASE